MKVEAKEKVDHLYNNWSRSIVDLTVFELSSRRNDIPAICETLTIIKYKFVAETRNNGVAYIVSRHS